jgi:hypothetical protein
MTGAVLGLTVLAGGLLGFSFSFFLGAIVLDGVLGHMDFSVGAAVATGSSIIGSAALLGWWLL